MISEPEKLINMKKIFLSTTLLLLLALGLNAQAIIENDKDDEKAIALIEQAEEFATKELYNLAVDNLQKAYNLSPNVFDC